MKGFQHQHEIERPYLGHRVSGANVEAHGDTFGGRVPLGVVHRRRIGVEADDIGVGEGLGDRDRGPTGTAPNVGDTHRRRRQCAVEVGQRGDPARHQVRQERRPIDTGLTCAERRAEVWIRHAAAIPIGVDHAIERATDAGNHLRERGEVRRMVVGGQHVHVLRGQPIPP
jgi:hypothetical protein